MSIYTCRNEKLYRMVSELFLGLEESVFEHSEWKTANGKIFLHISPVLVILI